MLRSPALNLPPEEQVQVLAAPRQAGYGYLPALYSMSARGVTGAVKECSQFWQ